MIEYILLGVIAPIMLNLMHMCVGIYVTGLGFSAMGFLTKSIGMLFLTWLGISKLGLDMSIFIPLLTFFWFFTHIVEGFVIQHYIQRNVPEWFQKLQIKHESIKIIQKTFKNEN